MKANKKIIIWSILLPLIFLIGFVYLSFSGTLREFRLKRESKPMIEKVEEYKNKYGSYPQKISDTGLPEPDESGPIYYQLEGSNNYIIWFGMGLGESVTYSSTIKEWDR
jgi:hypothetical protein